MLREKYILLKPLKNILEHLKECNTIIAGGAITSVFTDSKINDYDIYFRNNDDYLKLNSIMKNKENFSLVFSSESADTFRDKDKDLTIQLIKLERTMFNNPKDIINEFDYTICMGAYDVKNDMFILGDNFLKHNSQKRLVFNTNSKYPICALYRAKKFLNRGYKISGTEVIKITLSIHRLKLDNYKDLKEQLMGIDTLMLKELTDKLMGEEYATKEYDFEEFIHLIEEYLNKYEDVLL